jgi:NAD(P)-dependent dehydrogenase (short-subunit alcohol dehydrogenase family)
MNRVAVVTGGNRGIGREICRQLAELNIEVVLTARDIEAGNAAAGQFSEGGLPVQFHPLDVSQPTSVKQLADFVADTLGRLDILVNNAGIYIDRGISPLEIEPSLVQKTLDTNLFGPLYLCQSIIPIMKKKRYGRIVNISSQMGSLTDMGRGGLAYRVSKTALNALSRVLANELSGTNILVNTVDPGWVRTDMGGSSAPRSVSEGADTATWLATLPDDGPTGGFFRDRQQRTW